MINGLHTMYVKGWCMFGMLMRNMENAETRVLKVNKYIYSKAF